MATEYDLFIASYIDSDRLLQIVEDALGLDHFRHPEYRSAHCPSLVGRPAPGFILTAAAMSQRGAEIRGEWLGFNPSVSVGFRLNKMQDNQESIYHDMLRATSAVLECVSGDAALVLNGETGRLIRREGRVTVSVEPGTYLADALSELRVPYEFGRVPNAGDAPP